jgi:predicted acetyltransferase
MMTEQPKLVLLDGTMGAAYLAMVDAFEAAGEGYPYNNIPLARHDWAAFVAELRDEEQGINLPPGIVPQWTYVLVDGVTVVGEIRFRPDTAPPFGGGHDHIGYNVHPAYRRRGYGSLMLGRVLDLARERGLAGVSLTVGGDNAASKRLIATYGGRLLAGSGQEADGSDEAARRNDDVSVYWIAL